MKTSTRLKKIAVRIAVVIAAIVLLFMLLASYRVRDRHPGYHVDLTIKTSEPGRIMAGFSALSITPVIEDTWNDVDGNAKYEPKKGDTYNDNNGNGKFDAYWLAGFHSRRPANGIHDSVWARTVVIDDGTTRIALISLDAIGMFYDQVIDIRKRLPASLGIDYCMVASTHVHEAPDLMGIWGESPLKSGINKAYLELVTAQAVASVETAVADLEAVTLRFSIDEDGALPTVKDTRMPIVHDPSIYIMEAVRDDGSTKGTMVSWANHPETLWSGNLLITSDFPHFFRKGIEEVKGGICVYFNGAIGGLITTHPTVTIVHPHTGEELKEATFAKAEAQGIILTKLSLAAMEQPFDSLSYGSIELAAETFTVAFKNRMFRLAAVIGIMERGMRGWFQVATEMAVIKLGPLSLLTIPGEIYPEIVNGGIEAPEGQDFPLSPVEIPPLRELMPGSFKMVIGLANDELGYIIPKSQWDNKAPWLYNSERATYGEVNSLGPETAPAIHAKAVELINRLAD